MVVTRADVAAACHQASNALENLQSLLKAEGDLTTARFIIDGTNAEAIDYIERVKVRINAVLKQVE